MAPRSPFDVMEKPSRFFRLRMRTICIIGVVSSLSVTLERQAGRHDGRATMQAAFKASNRAAKGVSRNIIGDNVEASIWHASYRPDEVLSRRMN